jgi:uncharacterized membrane protein YdjX (TVP38/TMEM64 family)
VVHVNKSVTKPSLKKDARKLIGVGLALLFAIVIARITGLTQYLSLDGLAWLKNWIDGLGAIGPVVFIAVYVVATVAFLPGTPLTLLAGLVFGPVWGTLWTMIGATLGATSAFLLGRYVARDLVESWTAKNERLKRLDEAVEKHGWRMLIVTRLVPLFPFNLQNYAYGLTKVRLDTYALVTGVCMVPGIAAYTFVGGSLETARDDLGKAFVYLGISAVFFVLVSLIPGRLTKRGGQ